MADKPRTPALRQRKKGEAHTKAARARANAKPTFTGRARPQYVDDSIDVMTAARNRMRWIFDEFDNNVTVSNSGGKDSTVILELAAEVARERGFPLDVVWLDQECEYEATVEYQRYLMYERDDINFLWYQIPFRLFNATNHENEWLNVWGEGEEWVRDKEPNSIHVNEFKRKDGSTIDRFKELLGALNAHCGGALLSGMRAEESPGRRIFMVSNPSYKWVTWGSGVEGNPSARMFHPIYDWSFRDVWHAIETEGWRYNVHYDVMHRYGVPHRKMRVSNYSHSQALGALQSLQETEPKTWEAATRRLGGISTQGHLGRTSEMIKDLPYMFKDWEEYLHHLIDNLVIEEHQPKFRRMLESVTTSFPDEPRDNVARAIIPSVIANDYTWTSLNQYVMNLRTKHKWLAEQDEILEEVASEAAERKKDGDDDE